MQNSRHNSTGPSIGDLPGSIATVLRRVADAAQAIGDVGPAVRAVADRLASGGPPQRRKQTRAAVVTPPPEEPTELDQARADAALRRLGVRTGGAR